MRISGVASLLHDNKADTDRQSGADMQHMYMHTYRQTPLATPPIDRLKLGVATSGNCAGPGSGLGLPPARQM